MNIKVYGGTARDDKPLCLNCRHYAYRKTNNGEEIKICTENHGKPVILTKHIIECNDYIHINHVDLYTMKEQAHILRISSSGEPIGFMSNKEYRIKYGDDSID